MASRKRSQPSQEPPTRQRQADGSSNDQRAVRANRGGGGPAKRVEAFDQATERSKRKKTSASAIPDSEPLNPMAPTKGKRRGAPTKGKGRSAPIRSSKSTDAATVEARDSAPQTHLVPVGTEPDLRASELARFGFQPQANRPQERDLESNIDPRLLDGRTDRNIRNAGGQSSRDTLAGVFERERSGADVENDDDESFPDRVGLRSRRSRGTRDREESSGADERHATEDLHDPSLSESREDRGHLDSDEEDVLEQNHARNRRQRAPGASGWGHFDSTAGDVLEQNHARNQREDAAGASREDRDDAAEDVLEQHHARNRRPRAPDPDRLNDIRDNANKSDESDSDTSRPRRARRYSKTPRSEIQAKPTQLHFYPGHWRDVLELGKLNFRRWIAVENGFPTREQQLPPEAGECVSESLAEHQDKGGHVEQDYWTNHKDDMAVLVYEDQSTFRGEGKKIARNVVRNRYINLPAEIPNSQDLKTTLKERVQDWITDSKFLHGGKDSSGRTNNLANIALKELCILYYYEGRNALAKHFPDDFETAVPRKAIALGATMLLCCLNEWKTGVHRNEPFSHLNYHKVYKSILALIEKLEADAYHAAKFRQMQKDWAREGMLQVNSAEDDDEEYSGLQVHLD